MHLRICAAGTHLNSGHFCTMSHFTIKFRDRSTGCGSQNIWNQVSKRLISWVSPRLLESSSDTNGKVETKGNCVASSSCSKLYKTFIPVLLLTPKSCYLTVLKKNNKTQDTGCRLGTQVIVACEGLIEGQGEKASACISQSLSTAAPQ